MPNGISMINTDLNIFRFRFLFQKLYIFNTFSNLFEFFEKKIKLNGGGIDLQIEGDLKFDTYLVFI